MAEQYSKNIACVKLLPPLLFSAIHHTMIPVPRQNSSPRPARLLSYCSERRSKERTSHQHISMLSGSLLAKVSCQHLADRLRVSHPNFCGGMNSQRICAKGVSNEASVKIRAEPITGAIDHGILHDSDTSSKAVFCTCLINHMSTPYLHTELQATSSQQ